MSKPISWYAKRYVQEYGFHLVPIDPGQKFPSAKDWGNNCITDTEAAELYYDQNANWNMGLALGPSRMCSLDIDCHESFQAIIDEFGINPDELWSYPTIQGRDKGRRIMFRVPDGVSLPYCKLNWKREEDRAKSYTVFELRSACDGSQKQDVLPPSIHPDTGKPYKWIVQPPKPGQPWPVPPAWLLAAWTSWDKFKPQFQAACPWGDPAPLPPAREPQPRSDNQSSPIEAFNDAHDLRMTLERYGYTRKGKTRYLSPHTTTGLPGVVMFPDDRRCFIHHASDPLCSDDSGQPVNPFDLYCYYEHGNDAGRAVKAAAELLGLTHDRRPTVVEHKPKPKAEDSQAETATTAATVYGRGSYNLAEPLVFTTDKGKPIRHIDNLAEICRRIGVTIRYNMIAKEEEILIPGQSFSIDNMGNATLAWLRSECSLFNFPVDSIDGMVTYLADCNQYNPVAEWIGSKPWDGVSRVQAFYNTVAGEYDHVERKRLFKETLLKRWMVSAVAAAFSPNGISAAGVLTFQGAQYLGKTKWFKQLVPAELGVLKDGMILRPDDKDSVKQCVSFWLVELGELDATFRKADIAALKSFLTNDSDVLRRAYARKESKFARRTVFFASVNPKEFLHDPTGNRRYWTIEAKHLDHSHDIDMQQVWAEFYQNWRDGESYYLTNDEVNELNEHNESFTAVDPIEDRILTRLSWDSEPIDWRWATATDILMDIGFDRPTRSDATSCAAFIRKHNGNQGRRSHGKSLLYAPKKVPVQY